MTNNTALITGGAGFIGTNLVLYLAKNGWQITLLDNLSRLGTKNNLDFIKKNVSGKLLKIVIGDVRDKKISKLVNADVVFHLAGQTAVTTSVVNPAHDFDVNAFGTFNMLEAVRAKNPKAVFIYPSTNKVYGSLDHLTPKDFKQGVNESMNLDFHSPYGVSKGVADAYTKDYARIYNLSTVVFRQSCIYGLYQLGVEDQGWVAHIGAKAMFKKHVNIFGDGNQVRDLLFVDDLIEAYMASIKNIKKVSGQVFNIGGGVKNALSVNDYLDFLKTNTNKKLLTRHFKVRPGDQEYFVSDNTKAKKMLGWVPQTSYKKGLPIMLSWIKENKNLFDSFV